MYQHLHHGGAGRRREGEQEIEDLFEKMTENFPNLVKEMDTQGQEAQSPKQDEPKEAPTPRHIIIKIQKVKGKEYF